MFFSSPPASAGMLPQRDFPSEWKCRYWQWKLVARIFDDGCLSSSLLSFTHSQLCIIDKSASIHSIPPFTRIPFPAEIRGATFSLLQAERFPRLRHQICDIYNFFFFNPFFNLQFLCGCITIFTAFSLLRSKKASLKKTDTLKKGKEEHSQMLGQFP